MRGSMQAQALRGSRLLQLIACKARPWQAFVLLNSCFQASQKSLVSERQLHMGLLNQLAQLRQLSQVPEGMLQLPRSSPFLIAISYVSHILSVDSFSGPNSTIKQSPGGTYAEGDITWRAGSSS